MKDSLNIAIAGATGYVGIELVKILSKHSKVKILYLCANKSAGKKINGWFMVISLINEYYQFREKVKIESKFHDKIMNELKQSLQNEFDEISTADGIKAIIDENSWVLVRKSNTEDSIRISCESNNLEKTKQIQHDMVELVKQSYAKIK